MGSSAVIVIPCYNEATRLPVHQFKTFASAEHAVRFLFIDDGGRDAAWSVLEGLCQEAPQRFAARRLPMNVGKAEAVRQGVLHAFDAGPDYVGYWDADLATPWDAIASFCELLDARPDLEIAFGARVRLLGRAIERRAHRHYLGRVFATAASMTLGLAVYDTQCGAKLFRVTPANQLLFRDPFTSRWLMDVEILARLIQARRGTALPQAEAVVYELPLLAWRDVAGSKKAWDFAKGLYDLARIYWRYLRPWALIRSPRGPLD